MQQQTQSIEDPAASERTAIDLRELSELGRRARALAAYDNLSPGQRLELIAKHRPRLLFAELQKRHGCAFYWWPLENGADIWRVMLAKPARGVEMTVTAILSADHDRLDALWNDFESAVELCHIDAVHRRVGEISVGLRRFIDIEEAIVFPLLEAQMGTDDKHLTVVMRSEHREIERLLDSFDKLRLAKDCATILRPFDQPVEPLLLLWNHFRSEDTVLYPLIERVLCRAEQKDLVPIIQAFEI
ncbi:MAG: DUF2249 domain-containing protein [Candidatus Binataceae bacterium]